MSSLGNLTRPGLQEFFFLSQENMPEGHVPCMNETIGSICRTEETRKERKDGGRKGGEGEGVEGREEEVRVGRVGEGGEREGRGEEEENISPLAL